MFYSLPNFAQRLWWLALKYGEAVSTNQTGVATVSISCAFKVLAGFASGRNMLAATFEASLSTKEYCINASLM